MKEQGRVKKGFLSSASGCCAGEPQIRGLESDEE
jgi:hypothetical protein